jgi:hypothetical protein
MFNSEGTDYVDLVDQEIYDLSGVAEIDKELVSTLANHDPYYHNYYNGLKIFSTDNTNKTNFISAYSVDHTKIIDYNKMFTAITNEIQSVLTSLSISTDITFYYRDDISYELASTTRRNVNNSIIANFNQIPNSPIHLQLVYLDHNNANNTPYDKYITYQPNSYGKIYSDSLKTFGHGKYSDFLYVG